MTREDYQVPETLEDTPLRGPGLWRWYHCAVGVMTAILGVFTRHGMSVPTLTSAHYSPVVYLADAWHIMHVL